MPEIRYRKLQYLIKWTGHDIPNWRDAKDVNGLQAIDIFHQRYPHKPRPLPDDEDEEHNWEKSQRSLILRRGILVRPMGARGGGRLWEVAEGGGEW